MPNYIGSILSRSADESFSSNYLKCYVAALGLTAKGVRKVIKSLVLVFFFLCGAQANGQPVSGTLIGEKDTDILYYECGPVQNGRISCDFVQILLQKKSTDADWAETVSSLKDMLADKDAGQLCETFLPISDFLRTGKMAPMPGARASDIEALQDQITGDLDYFRAVATAGTVFCQERTEEHLKALFYLFHQRGSETCTPLVNRFSQTFVQVSDLLWAVESSPSGECGVVDTSRFSTSGDATSLWDYISSKVVLNKNGNINGLCSSLDETEQPYKLNLKPKKKGCQFIE